MQINSIKKSNKLLNYSCFGLSNSSNLPLTNLKYQLDTVSFKGRNGDGQNIFQKLLNQFFNDDYEQSIEFRPTCSIVEDKHEYLRQILDYETTVPKKDVKRFYINTYNTLNTQEEKELFKKYFGEYLTDVQSRQPKHQSSKNSVQQSGQYEINSKKKPTPNQAQNPTLNTVQLPKIKSCIFKRKTLKTTRGYVYKLQNTLYLSS